MKKIALLSLGFYVLTSCMAQEPKNDNEITSTYDSSNFQNQHDPSYVSPDRTADTTQSQRADSTQR